MEIKTIIFKEDFPISGEAYKVGKLNGKYFFAWGSKYPYDEELPIQDITDGASGIEWFITEEKALHYFLDVVEASYNTWGSPIEKVMTAKEAEERWGLREIRQSITLGKLKKYIESGHVRKSGGTWLVTEEAMRDAYGDPK